MSESDMAVQSDLDVRLKLSISESLISEVSDYFEAIDVVYLTDFVFGFYWVRSYVKPSSSCVSSGIVSRPI